ncbi:MAG TPA: hypothetical protein VJT33_01760 [bacterium]|nr:hypothetical protein [bacterium]
MIGTIRPPKDGRLYAPPFAGLLDHRGIGEGILPVSRVAVFAAG